MVSALSDLERGLYPLHPGRDPRIKAKIKAALMSHAGVGDQGDIGEADRLPHPCPFPVPMIEQIILGWSNPGDVVLDPFAGSGSTAVAALRLGRRCLSVEQNTTYVVGAANRLLNEQSGVIDRQADEIARLKAELMQAKPEHERLTPTSEVALVEEAISKSVTKADAVRALGWGLNTFSYKRLDRIAADHQINTSHFLGQGWRRGNRLSGQPPDAA